MAALTMLLQNRLHVPREAGSGGKRNGGKEEREKARTEHLGSEYQSWKYTSFNVFVVAVRLAPEVFVPASHQRLHFAVCNRSLQHPESAVRVHPSKAAGAKLPDDGFDSARDFVG